MTRFCKSVISWQVLAQSSVCRLRNISIRFCDPILADYVPWSTFRQSIPCRTINRRRSFQPFLSQFDHTPRTRDASFRIVKTFCDRIFREPLPDLILPGLRIATFQVLFESTHSSNCYLTARNQGLEQFNRPLFLVLLVLITVPFAATLMVIEHACPKMSLFCLQQPMCFVGWFTGHSSTKF